MATRCGRKVAAGQLWLSAAGNEVRVVSVAGELVTVVITKLARVAPAGLSIGQRITWHVSSLVLLITA